MVTIAQVVREFVRERDFYEEALARGILNYKNMAKEIIPDLELDPRMKSVNITISAVMMALRRLSQQLSEEFTKLEKIAVREHEMRLFNTIYGLSAVTIVRSPEVMTNIPSIYDIVDVQGGDFLTITQGIYEITIISNMEYIQKITDLFSKKLIKNTNRQLASLSLKIPETAIDNEGLFYTVTKALYFDQVNIIEIVSTFTEMTFILKELDLTSAIHSLRKLIQ